MQWHSDAKNTKGHGLCPSWILSGMRQPTEPTLTRGHCHLLKPSSHLVQPRSSTLPLLWSRAALLKKSLDYFPRSRPHTIPPGFTTALPATSSQVPAPSPPWVLGHPQPLAGRGSPVATRRPLPPSPPYLSAAAARGLRGAAGRLGAAPPPAPHVGDPAAASPRHRHRARALLRAAGRGGRPRRRRLPGLLLRTPGSPHAQLQAEEERGGEQAQAESGAPPERPLLGHGVGGCPARRCRPAAGFMPPAGRAPRPPPPKLGSPRPERGRPGRGRDAPVPARRGLRDAAVLARRRPEGCSEPRREQRPVRACGRAAV